MLCIATILPRVEHISTGHIVDDDLRKRVKYLGHLPYGCEVNFLECDWRDVVVPEILARFRTETGRRRKRNRDKEAREEKDRIISNPPDILLTNYMMLELILTRQDEAALVRAAQGVQFIVFDELHTYRGRQGADVALLIRRLRERLHSPDAVCVGTSATMSSSPVYAERQAAVAQVASRIFGVEVTPQQVIGETLERVTSGVPSVAELRDAAAQPVPATFEGFIQDALVVWLENRVGLRWDDAAGRFDRQPPQAVAGDAGLAAQLAAETDLPAVQCLEALQGRLLAGNALRHPATGRPVFAFRLHQFISKAATVYAPLLPPTERLEHLTLRGQVYAPNIEEGVAEECMKVTAAHNRKVRLSSPLSSLASCLLPRGLSQRI